MEETIKTTIAEDNVLYCRHCLKPISKDAETCPSCGNSDPFYFHAIKNVKKNLKVSWWFYLIIAFLVEIAFQLFGLEAGILHWGFSQLAVFAFSCIIANACMWTVRKYFKEAYEKEMTDVFTKSNDIKALTRWNAIANSIID